MPSTPTYTPLCDVSFREVMPLNSDLELISKPWEPFPMYPDVAVIFPVISRPDELTFMTCLDPEYQVCPESVSTQPKLLLFPPIFATLASILSLWIAKVARTSSISRFSFRSVGVSYLYS